MTERIKYYPVRKKIRMTFNMDGQSLRNRALVRSYVSDKVWLSWESNIFNENYDTFVSRLGVKRGL
jgi:hypothetical protein